MPLFFDLDIVFCFISLATENVEEMLKEEFKILLDNISSTKEMTNEEASEVIHWLLSLCYLDESWIRTFCEQVKDEKDYVAALKYTTNFLEKPISQYIKDQNGDITDLIDLTFLAHGKIKGPLVPCSLYHMNDHVRSITLYEPWGCALHATAAYGILTGTINVDMVRYLLIPIYLNIYLNIYLFIYLFFLRYTDTVLPATPTDWNTLPRDDTLIPQVFFSHECDDGPAWEMLRELLRRFGGNPRGLIIPYFRVPGEPALPEIQLWALCHSVGILGWRFKKHFRIHVAACLTPNDRSILTTDLFPCVHPLSTVRCSQYCVVPIWHPSLRDDVTMCIPYFVEQPENIVFEVLQRLLH